MKKLYFLTLALLIGAGLQAQTVAYLSEEGESNEITQMFMDSIEAYGYTAEYVSMSLISSTSWGDYDAVIVGEKGGSGNMQAYNEASAWEVPTLHFKTYAIDDGPGTPNPLVQGSAFNSAAKSSVWEGDSEPMSVLIVQNNEDILQCWEEDDEVVWTDGWNENVNPEDGAGEGHIQTLDLTQAADGTGNFGDNATMLATNKFAEDNSMATTGFLWKVEANDFTERLVVMGIHNGFLEMSTANFWTIVHGSLQWIMGEDVTTCTGGGGTSINTHVVNSFDVYPNPVNNQLTINIDAIITEVSIVDVTGKTVANVTDVNDNTAVINTSDLANGLYIVKLKDSNGETYAQKILK